MSPSTLIALALIVPTVVAVLIPFVAARPNIREAVTLIGAGLLFAVVLQMLPLVLAGEEVALHLFTVVPAGASELLPELTIAFSVEPLGMLFALVASGLWIVNSIYSIGYMRAEKAHRQTLFYFCFAVAIAATMGAAMAGNLFTLFLFYELLTLSTYPLVTHKANEDAVKAGRVYLMLLIGTVFFVFAFQRFRASMAAR